MVVLTAETCWALNEYWIYNKISGIKLVSLYSSNTYVSFFLNAFVITAFSRPKRTHLISVRVVDPPMLQFMWVLAVYTVCVMLSPGSQCSRLVITGDESDLCTCFSHRQVNVCVGPVFCVCNRRESWLCNGRQGVRAWWSTLIDRFCSFARNSYQIKTGKYIYKILVRKPGGNRLLGRPRYS